MTWDNLSYPCNICNGKFQQQVQSVASRACWKFQEQVQSVASRACWKFQEQVQSVASRARWKFQEQVQSVASRARWKFQGQVQSVASRFCCRTHTDDRRRMDVILFIFSCIFVFFFGAVDEKSNKKEEVQTRMTYIFHVFLPWTLPQHNKRGFAIHNLEVECKRPTQT